jgi:ABC-2 type transport system ATP-binding protein
MGVVEQLVYLAKLHRRAGRAAPHAAEAWLQRLGLAERGGGQLQI